MPPPKHKTTSLPLSFTLSLKLPLSLLSSSMASLPFSTLTLFLSISLFISLFFSPSHSLTCTSQQLPSSNHSYANCTDLPSLNATLHFTYNDTNSSLVVAFSAEPAKSDGWVGWGINPSGGGMIGAQAFIAYKLNGKIIANTYNLTSYQFINQTKLSFDVSELSAVDSKGVITIFAAVQLPEKADNLSQVWQVGPVSNGIPARHDIGPANLQAKAPLVVRGSTTGQGNNNSSTGGSGSGGNSTSGEKNGGALVMGERFGLGFYLGLLLVLLSFMSM